MKLRRRQFLQLAASAAALSAVSTFARADTYPNRPVRIVVGFPPGSATDIDMRLIAAPLGQKLGQEFLVDNKPGAGSNLAAEIVSRASHDGYTLLAMTVTNAVNATLYPNLSFDIQKDIVPVISTFTSPNTLVINPSIPAKTLPEFIAYAKANPGKLNMASAGNGNSTHMAGELFKMMAGVNIVHVPYRGVAPALTDLLDPFAELIDSLPDPQRRAVAAATFVGFGAGLAVAATGWTETHAPSQAIFTRA